VPHNLRVARTREDGDVPVMTVDATTHSPHRDARPLVLFVLEPRSYSEAIGGAIATMNPGVDVRVVETENLVAEMERRSPVLVFCNEPKPSGCEPAVRWLEFRPYEEPDVVLVDGLPKRVPGLDLQGLLGLVERLCGERARRLG
jgi:hypothetical protein